MSMQPHPGSCLQLQTGISVAGQGPRRFALPWRQPGQLSARRHIVAQRLGRISIPAELPASFKASFWTGACCEQPLLRRPAAPRP